MSKRGIREVRKGVRGVKKGTRRTKMGRGLEFLFFTADRCPVCKQVKPLVLKIAKESGVKVRTIDVNTDEGRGLASQFLVRGLPTVVVRRGGRAVESCAGSAIPARLRAVIG